MSIGRLESEADLERFVLGLFEQRLTGQQVGLASAQEGLEALQTAIGTPEAWVAPTFQNSWAAVSGYPVGYRKDALGQVHLKGLIQSGTVTASAFTLPVGYRPAAESIFVVASNGAYGDVRVQTDGRVIPQVGSSAWVSLVGVSFWLD